MESFRISKLRSEQSSCFYLFRFRIATNYLQFKTPRFFSRETLKKERKKKVEEVRSLVFRGVPRRKKRRARSNSTPSKQKDTTELTNKTRRVGTYNVAKRMTRIRSNKIKAMSGARMTSFPDTFPDLG